MLPTTVEAAVTTCRRNSKKCGVLGSVWNSRLRAALVQSDLPLVCQYHADFLTKPSVTTSIICCSFSSDQSATSLTWKSGEVLVSGIDPSSIRNRSRLGAWLESKVTVQLGQRFLTA